MQTFILYSNRWNVSVRSIGWPFENFPLLNVVAIRTAMWAFLSKCQRWWIWNGSKTKCICRLINAFNSIEWWIKHFWFCWLMKIESFLRTYRTIVNLTFHALGNITIRSLLHASNDRSTTHGRGRGHSQMQYSRESHELCSSVHSNFQLIWIKGNASIRRRVLVIPLSTSYQHNIVPRMTQKTTQFARVQRDRH